MIFGLMHYIKKKKNKQNAHIKGKITESNIKVIEFATTVI